MSEETFDFICTVCSRDNKTVKGVKYCVECCGYCCQPCTDVHKKFPTLENHNLMDVYQVNQASGQQAKLLEIPTERCSIHVAKVLDMYCEGHNVVGCSICFVKDHKSCEDRHIHYIPDMIDTIFKLADCKQTQRLLKDMIVTMESVSTSKDTQLETLNRTKIEALDKVTAFQKALEAVVKKAAESSKREVEAMFKELKDAILKDKQTIEDIREDLKMTDEKLKRSNGNRAQKFVWSKLAEEKIKEANSETMKQTSHNVDHQLTFIPDQSLMEYAKALLGVGQVQKKVTPKQKHDLYKIKGSKDINIKLSDDSTSCSSHGCCMTHGDRLLVTDYTNKKLKRIDIQKMLVTDYCTLDSAPYGVCCISEDEVAVACQDANKIQFVSIRGKLSLTRQIEMPHKCHGIAFNDGKLYVTDYGHSLYVYSMAGTLQKEIKQDKVIRNYLFHSSGHIIFNESGSRMFVAGGNNGVVCFDGMGNYLSTVVVNDKDFTDGVCVDDRGNVFATAYQMRGVVQFSEDGKEVGAVVKGYGSRGTRAVCFHPRLKIMFVTMHCSAVVKKYELE